MLTCDKLKSGLDRLSIEISSLLMSRGYHRHSIHCNGLLFVLTSHSGFLQLSFLYFCSRVRYDFTYLLEVRHSLSLGDIVIIKADTAPVPTGLPFQGERDATGNVDWVAFWWMLWRKQSRAEQRWSYPKTDCPWKSFRWWHLCWASVMKDCGCVY